MTRHRVYVRVNGMYMWPFDVWARDEKSACVCARLHLEVTTGSKTY